MSETHQTDHQNPSLTVLQLDTVFPRIPGDVASEMTYRQPIVINKIPGASVETVISERPDQYDIRPFEKACAQIKTGLGVSSCGFLGYWQDHLNNLCGPPFVASSLSDLTLWQQHYEKDEIAILTFDAEVLSTPLYQPLLAGFSGLVIGMSTDMHLRQVISEDKSMLDQKKAEMEILDLLSDYLSQSNIKALVLECTNLPPYKSAIKEKFNVEIYDILTSIHARNPYLVRPEFL